jgi:NAD-dependent deacetylase
VQVTVLSGAGISAESGVPTFRDAETGLWAKVDPYEISSAQGWSAHPEKVWAWYLWRHYMMGAVQPNNGHLAAAAWQDYADVHVVTQNVDDLHERPASASTTYTAVFQFRCDRCQHYHDDSRDTRPVASVDPPRCACGGLIRPTWCGSAKHCPTGVAAFGRRGDHRRPGDRGGHLVVVYRRPGCPSWRWPAAPPSSR